MVIRKNPKCLFTENWNYFILFSIKSRGHFVASWETWIDNQNKVQRLSNLKVERQYDNQNIERRNEHRNKAYHMTSFKQTLRKTEYSEQNVMKAGRQYSFICEMWKWHT